MLEIKNVTKSFDRPLFKEMSMTFQETGMYVIVGKSGSGKSTLLNILGGLDNEYQGVIEIDGQDIRQIPHYIRKYIGFIFQQFYLIEEMNVKENVNLISYFKRIMISKKEYNVIKQHFYLEVKNNESLFIEDLLLSIPLFYVMNQQVL